MVRCEECGAKQDSEEGSFYDLCWDCYVIHDFSSDDDD